MRSHIALLGLGLFLLMLVAYVRLARAPLYDKLIGKPHETDFRPEGLSENRRLSAQDGSRFKGNGTFDRFGKLEDLLLALKTAGEEGRKEDGERLIERIKLHGAASSRWARDEILENPRLSENGIYRYLLLKLLESIGCMETSECLLESFRLLDERGYGASAAQESLSIAIIVEILSRSPTSEKFRDDALDLLAQLKKKILKVQLVMLLGSFAEPREVILDSLRNLLRMDPDHEIRAAAAESIGRMRSLEDAPELMRILGSGLTSSPTEGTGIEAYRVAGALVNIVGPTAFIGFLRESLLPQGIGPWSNGMPLSEAIAMHYRSFPDEDLGPVLGLLDPTLTPTEHIVGLGALNSAFAGKSRPDIAAIVEQLFQSSGEPTIQANALLLLSNLAGEEESFLRSYDLAVTREGFSKSAARELLVVHYWNNPESIMSRDRMLSELKSKDSIHKLEFLELMRLDRDSMTPRTESDVFSPLLHAVQESDPDPEVRDAAKSVIEINRRVLHSIQ